MARRPVRITISLTNEQWEQICWYAYQERVAPGTQAGVLFKRALDEDLALNTPRGLQFAQDHDRQHGMVPLSIEE